MFSEPYGIAIDGTGNIYFTSADQVFKATSSGVVTLIAGTGTGGFSGDGGPATAAEFLVPTGVAVDGSGNVYIAERNQRVRKVNTSGIITTIAGTGTIGTSGDGGPATLATLDYPESVAVDGAGNIYIGCNTVVRKIDVSGIISTIAGTGTIGYTGDGGPATLAQVDEATGIAIDGSGNFFIADRMNSRIRKINTSGIITTFAGSGTIGVGAFGGDGGPATAAMFSGTTGVAVDGSGNIIITDEGNSRIREVNSSGIITTIAGSGTGGFYGDGGAATAAGLFVPWGTVIDAVGNIYITDAENGRIRKINCNTAPITGASTVCAGSATVLTDLYSGGTWTTSGSDIATVSGGTVNGVSQGVDTIFYTTTNVCGTATAIKIDTVYPSSAGTVNGTDSVCIGYTVTLSDAVTGGVWSSTNTSIATVSSAGVVTGVSAGLDIIKYTVSDVCGTYNALFPINITTSSGTIAGSDSVCVGYTVALTDPAAGGVWSSVSGVVSVTSLGVVTGVSVGVGIVEYTVTNACGTNAALFPINVTPANATCALGIVNHTEPAIKFEIFPNPADRELTIAFTEIIRTLTISNLLGQVVINQECNSDKVRINIEDLPKGVFFVRINGQEVKRFLKDQ